ncbi:MAG TPA: DUF4375 domain-containing protein [Tepidisphaeraceae bacterium]|jgi:hypothetical protein|nr:DUF4375 domain-containing protein [Tepidisphaeraceae bacterium]
MGGAWAGDWKARIHDFARREGYDHIWNYLVAHPGVPLTTVADTIGDAAAIQIEQLVIEHCMAHRVMGEFIRDQLVRSIHWHLPNGWGSGNDFKQVQAVMAGAHLREPFSQLAKLMSGYLRRTSPPPNGWLPSSAEDPIIRDAYDGSMALLSEEKRRAIELGLAESAPGDRYWAAIEPIWESISIYRGPEVFAEQYEKVSRKLGHLFATHWCQSEVCNGGFHQFFSNPTGVLAPEAAAGFGAIGMPRCAAIVSDAMTRLGNPYPRDQMLRRAKLADVGGTESFRGLDKRFYDELESESGGFSKAADAYADRTS